MTFKTGSRKGRLVYRRHPFAGSRADQAYIWGLKSGDISAFRDSASTIRARLSTTHPAMSELFVATFGRYGRCVSMPDRAFLPSHYCWKLAVNLDNSFESVLHVPPKLPTTPRLFFGFLAGYSDSEGCWCIYSNKGHPAFAFVMESKDKPILLHVRATLRRMGFHPLFYRDVGRGKGRLELRRRAEVIDLAGRLIPLSKHREKRERMSLILKSHVMNWNELHLELRKLKFSTREEVAKFVGEAERQYKKLKKRASSEGSSASLV